MIMFELMSDHIPFYRCDKCGHASGTEFVHTDADCIKELTERLQDTSNWLSLAHDEISELNNRVAFVEEKIGYKYEHPNDYED
jgi:hypothetical protein